MKKIRRFYNIRKETKWINNVCKEGYTFSGKDIWGNYIFEKSNNFSEVYKIDFRFFKTKADYSEYTALMDDSGWILIKGGKNSGKQYLVKRNNTGNEKIFSDIQSENLMYKKYRKSFLVNILIVLFYLAIANIFVLNQYGGKEDKDGASIVFAWQKFISGSNLWWIFLVFAVICIVLLLNSILGLIANKKMH